MELNIPIKRGTKANAVLRLLNPFLNTLTDTEISIVSTILDMEINSITRTNRTNLRDRLKMGKYTFNNYIQNLKRKGVILQTTTDLIINPKIVTLTGDHKYTITFVEN